MNVIFVEPSFPNNQREFVRALHAIGAHRLGPGRAAVRVARRRAARLARRLRAGRLGDERGRGRRRPSAACSRRVWVDRLEATVEAHILPVARVREACTIPGLSSRAAWLCRDKVAMKEVLRRAGVPCAASAAVSSAHEAREFAQAVGFPLIIKPRDAAGAKGTYRVDDWHSSTRRCRRAASRTARRRRSRSSSSATRGSTTR